MTLIAKIAVLLLTAMLLFLVLFGTGWQSLCALTLLAGMTPVAFVADVIQLKPSPFRFVKLIALWMSVAVIGAILFADSRDQARLGLDFLGLWGGPFSVLFWITGDSSALCSRASEKSHERPKKKVIYQLDVNRLSITMRKDVQQITMDERTLVLQILCEAFDGSFRSAAQYSAVDSSGKLYGQGFAIEAQDPDVLPDVFPPHSKLLKRQ